MLCLLLFFVFGVCCCCVGVLLWCVVVLVFLWVVGNWILHSKSFCVFLMIMKPLEPTTRESDGSWAARSFWPPRLRRRDGSPPRVVGSRDFKFIKTLWVKNPLSPKPTQTLKTFEAQNSAALGPSPRSLISLEALDHPQAQKNVESRIQ